MSRTKHSFWFKLSTSMSTCSHQPPSETGHDDAAAGKLGSGISDAYLESEPGLLVAPVEPEQRVSHSSLEGPGQMCGCVADLGMRRSLADM